MAHRIEDISGIVSAAIVVYRRMQETVQTQYDLQHPTRDQHSTLHTYYGVCVCVCVCVCLCVCVVAV